LTISDTIESILQQSYRPIEYILIDGSSTDKTIAVIKKYEEKFIRSGISYSYISEPDKGIYDAMNKGIAKSNGSIIGIVNSDDYLENDAISIVMKAYEKNPEFKIINGLLRVVDKKKNELSIKDKSNIKEIFNYYGMPVNHPSTFVSKDLYDEYGTFDISYYNAADYELILRFISRGIKITSLKEILSNMRIGGRSDDYITTFIETRKINIKYGCKKRIAWKNFFVSITKAFIYKNFIQK
jgi:glycosyltransferase involved in cell wall biosynthesis